jgi:hypothetical protein
MTSFLTIHCDPTLTPGGGDQSSCRGSTAVPKLSSLGEDWRVRFGEFPHSNLGIKTTQPVPHCPQNSLSLMNRTPRHVINNLAGGVSATSSHDRLITLLHLHRSGHILVLPLTGYQDRQTAHRNVTWIATRLSVPARSYEYWFDCFSSVSHAEYRAS